MKKLVLAVIVIFAVICLIGCVAEFEGGPYPGEKRMIRCIAVKDIHILELEDYGEIHLYGVKYPIESKKKYEEGLGWLREVCEGKEVLVWFGDEIEEDDEGRPYAMVFLDENEETCVNTELIAREYASLDVYPLTAREDFFMHEAWDKMLKDLEESTREYAWKTEEEIEQLEKELGLSLTP